MNIIRKNGVAEWDLNKIITNNILCYLPNTNSVSMLYCTDIIHTELLKEQLMILMAIEKPYITERHYVNNPTFCILCETYKSDKIINVFNFSYNSRYYKSLVNIRDICVHICDKCYMKNYSIQNGHIITIKSDFIQCGILTNNNLYYLYRHIMPWLCDYDDFIINHHKLSFDKMNDWYDIQELKLTLQYKFYLIRLMPLVQDLHLLIYKLVILCY